MTVSTLLGQRVTRGQGVIVIAPAVAASAALSSGEPLGADGASQRHVVGPIEDALGASTRMVWRDFAPSRSMVREARRWVGGELSSCDPDVVDNCRVALSELFTNAVVHGSGTVSVGVDVEDDRVGLVVADRGRNLPHLRSPKSDDERHRGLPLVLGLAHGFLVLPLAGGGKAVIATFTAPCASTDTATDTAVGAP